MYEYLYKICAQFTCFYIKRVPYKWLFRHLPTDTTATRQSHVLLWAWRSQFKIYTFWIYSVLFGIFISMIILVFRLQKFLTVLLLKLSYTFLTMSDYNLDLKSEMNKTRKLPLVKDTRASDSSQEEAIDQWARRRKQFKDSKKCSSTGGSSINSTITEGSSEYFSLTIVFFQCVIDSLTGFSAEEINLQFITWVPFLLIIMSKHILFNWTISQYPLLFI